MLRQFRPNGRRFTPFPKDFMAITDTEICEVFEPWRDALYFGGAETARTEIWPRCSGGIPLARKRKNLSVAIAINTNISAQAAANALSLNRRTAATALQQLSTGSRINRAADDSAGMAIGANMTAQILGLNMAVRNANDGISLLQTADGGIGAQSDLLQRMRELAVQAATDTVSSDQKTYLNGEFLALKDQISQITSNTTWNGIGVLNGTGGRMEMGDFEIRLGSTSSDIIKVKITAMTTSLGKNLAAIASSTITTASASANAINAIDTALDKVNSQRALIGAGINRLNYAVNNLTSGAQNATQSRSQVLDTDYAKVTSELARTQIIQQAATAMLAQANQQQQTVMALLK